MRVQSWEAFLKNPRKGWSPTTTPIKTAGGNEKPIFFGPLHSASICSPPRAKNEGRTTFPGFCGFSSPTHQVRWTHPTPPLPPQPKHGWVSHDRGGAGWVIFEGTRQQAPTVVSKNWATLGISRHFSGFLGRRCLFGSRKEIDREAKMIGLHPSHCPR